MSEEFFKKLKELDLPKGKYAVFGSGPIAVRGLRESRDLDILVVQDLYNEYKNKPDWEEKTGNQDKYLEKDDIEFWYNWSPGEWDVDQLIKDAEIIDDLPFVKLEDVLRWKKLKGTEKDLKDIKLIEKYLKL
ncbi:hypothetical protein ACFL3E_00875 [Patescibacteria group bacterium]